MIDLPPDSDSNDNTSTPRWVKVFAAIIVILVLAVVIIHLTGHGMGDHMR